MADATEVNALLENVEQFINDEKRIVTYEFLSQSCGIHVNLAKTVLGKYAENLKKKQNADTYNIVYSVGGYAGKNLKFMLVKGDHLEQTKSKLDKLLSVHVYSIQCGKLKSLDVLYNSNLTELKRSIQQCCSQAGISCGAAKLKSASESSNKTVTEVKNVAEQAKPLQSTFKKDESNANTTSKTENGKEASKTIQENVSTKEKTSNKLSEKKQSGKQAIATLFAKQQAKEPVEKKSVVVEETKKPITNKRVIREPSDDENENINANKDKACTKRFKLSEEEKPLKSQPASKTKAKQSQKKGKKPAKSDGKTQRKRIQQFSDSESSGDEEEDQDIILSSPERPAPPAPMSEDDEDVLEATIVEPSSELIKRSRKLVAKTFMDENGYVVTKREYETIEENEAPKAISKPVENKKIEISPKTEEQPATKRPTPPGKSKQKSITSFFTRK